MTDSIIRTLSSRIVYTNRWMSVREDKIRFPSGADGIYGVVDKPAFAVIVPLHADGRLQLVRQFRYPVQARLWKVPQGAWEGHADVDPAILARGELEEETGWKAGRLERIGEYLQAPGYSSQGYTLFVAHDLSPGTLARDAEEQDMETAAFSLQNVLGMIDTGAIKDTTTIAAIGLLRLTGRL